MHLQKRSYVPFDFFFATIEQLFPQAAQEQGKVPLFLVVVSGVGEAEAAVGLGRADVQGHADCGDA